MGALLDATRRVLEEGGWVVSPVEDGGFLRIAFAGENGQWGCLAAERADGHQLIFYSVYPDTVPPDARDRVGEYLGRVNWGMPLGNFEMDRLSGEIRFRTSLATEGPVPGPELIRPVAYANVYTMDQYLDDIAGVISGSVAADLPDRLRARGTGA